MQRRGFLKRMLAGGVGFAISGFVIPATKITPILVNQFAGKTITIIRESINIGRIAAPIRYYIVAVLVEEDS